MRLPKDDLECSFCGNLKLELRRRRDGVPYEIGCPECRATWGFHGDQILTTHGPKPLTIIGELGAPELN